MGTEMTPRNSRLVVELEFSEINGRDIHKVTVKDSFNGDVKAMASSEFLSLALMSASETMRSVDHEKGMLYRDKLRELYEAAEQYELDVVETEAEEFPVRFQKLSSKVTNESGTIAILHTPNRDRHEADSREESETGNGQQRPAGVSAGEKAGEREAPEGERDSREGGDRASFIGKGTFTNP